MRIDKLEKKTVVNEKIGSLVLGKEADNLEGVEDFAVIADLSVASEGVDSVDVADSAAQGMGTLLDRMVLDQTTNGPISQALIIQEKTGTHQLVNRVMVNDDLMIAALEGKC